MEISCVATKMIGSPRNAVHPISGIVKSPKLKMMSGAEKREMTKYIIGTISKLDAPLTPSMKGEAATERILSHITQEDVQRTRDEVLHTGVDDIKKCGRLIRDVMDQNYFCVIGSEGKIRDNKDIFKDLIPVFE